MVQSHDESEAERDSCAGVELRQLEPAAAEGTARRAKQLGRTLPGRQVRITICVLRLVKDICQGLDHGGGGGLTGEYLALYIYNKYLITMRGRSYCI